MSHSRRNREVAIAMTASQVERANALSSDDDDDVVEARRVASPSLSPRGPGGGSPGAGGRRSPRGAASTIRSQESRALALHSATQGSAAAVDLASSWSNEHVLQNAMDRRRALEKQLASVEKELEKVAKQIEIIDELPEGDQRKEVEERTGCTKATETCFGTTPNPRPCGSPLYQVQWLMSGIFIAIVKYVFAITCALMVHESADVFEASAGIGVNVQLLCIIVSQFCLAAFTKIGVTVAGPDVVAAIFAGGMAEIIAEETADNPSAALPTLLLMMAVTTLACAVAWLLIGYLRAARIVDYLPVCVVCGFLGCLGYKVMYYAVKLSVGKQWYHPEEWAFWKLLLPVIPLGFGLYYLKKFHHQLHVNPIVLLALFLLIPPAILFSVTAQPDYNITDLRTEGWLFPEMENEFTFYSAWTSLNFTNIDGTAAALCLPSVFTTVIVVSMAFLITLQAAKQTMGMPEVDAAHEMKVFGWTNLIGSVFLASPGYTQIKFTLLNYHIINNRTDKKPGLFAGTFALVMLLGGFLLINYLPRLTVGMLLVYAGLPLVEDNLIFSFRRVTKKEFVAIWVIVLVNAIAGVWTSYSFLIAVLTGLVLATLIFAVQYGRNPVIRDVLSGRDYQSAVVRPYTEQRLVERIGIRTRILELEGFLFFGSTIQILNKFKAVVEQNKALPFPERVRYFIVDFTHAKNIDHSSCLTFKDLKQIAKPSLVVLVFTGMNSKVHGKMRTHGVLPVADKATLDTAAVVVHTDLDHGAEWVEERLLARATEIRSQWLVFDSFRKAHSEAIIKASCEAFEAVIGSDVGANLWKYATLRTLDKGQILCRQGSINSTLYVLQEGVLTSFVMDAGNTRVRLHKMTRGAFVNDECLFLDLPVAFSVIANQRCVLWAITRASMKRMEAHDPHLAMEILRKVLRHTSTVRTRLEREVRAVQNEVLQEEGESRALERKNATEATQRLGKSIIAGSTMNLFDGGGDPGSEGMGTGGFGDVVDDPDLPAELDGLAPLPTMKKPRRSQRNSIGYAAGDHHHHAFQHLHVPTSKSPLIGAMPTPPGPRGIGGDSAGGGGGGGGSGSGPARLGSARRGKLSWQEVQAVQPHLPKQVEEDAKRCFFFHAQHIHLVVNDELGIAERRGPADGADVDDIDGFQLDAAVGLSGSGGGESPATPTASVARGSSRSPNGTPTGSPTTSPLRRPPMGRQMSADKYLDLDELEKAVMDLGVFPTHNEIEKMHCTLVRGHSAAYVDLEEFLEMIRALKLARLSGSAKRELYKMYCRVCNRDGLLTRQHLSQLMTSLGHPEDEVELEKLMHDWDVKGRGVLDFGAFLSIVSSTLKAEEIQVKCENDFKRFNPRSASDDDFGELSGSGARESKQRGTTDDSGGGRGGGVVSSETAEELLNYHITVEDLIRVYGELGLVLTPEIAAEMLYDADISGDGGVAYDDLISCIETIGTNEVYHAMKTSRTGLRAIQEAKMGEKFKIALSDHGGAAGVGEDYSGSTAPLQLASLSPAVEALSSSQPEAQPATITHRNPGGTGGTSADDLTPLPAPALGGDDDPTAARDGDGSDGANGDSAVAQSDKDKLL